MAQTPARSVAADDGGLWSVCLRSNAAVPPLDSVQNSSSEIAAGFSELEPKRAPMARQSAQAFLYLRSRSARGSPLGHKAFSHEGLFWSLFPP
jgi:hypothetical protein